MITLNQLSSSTASLLKQPFNHELKERLIDSYKQLIAERIRHSVERHGIDEQLKLNYTESILVYDEDGNEKYNSTSGDFFENSHLWSLTEIESFNFKTKNRVFEPIRFKNDAPFTFVGTTNRLVSFPYRGRSQLKYTQSLFSTGNAVSYHLSNGKIVLACHNVDKLTRIPKIEIETIFYEPEKVITLLDNEDGLDTAIPLPHDAISGITSQLLQTEFGIISPNNIEVKVNEKDRPVQ